MEKHQQQPEELRKRINHFMAKLADRDTESMAYVELDSICRNLTPDYLPTFVSIVGDTRDSDKIPVRRHSLRLIALLAHFLSPTTLLPQLPRILSAILRRIRDPESGVRAALIDAVRSIAATVPAGTLVSSLLRPLADTLFHEQEVRPQSASAFSLCAVLDEPNATNAADLPDFLHCLVPRLMKLVQSPVFKAKPALLTLLGSVVGAGGARDGAALQALVPCLVEFIGSEDWSARKAAAEALIRLATAERDFLSGFKLSCVAYFEARRYDKVKIVRDSINRMLEAWRKISEGDLDVPQPQSHFQLCSSQEETASVWKCPATSINSHSSVQSSPPFIARKTRLSSNRSSRPTSSPIKTAKKIVGRSCDLKKKSALSRRMGQGKNLAWRVDISVPDAASSAVVCDDKLEEGKGRGETIGEQGRVEENDRSRLEARRVLFEKNCEEKKMGGLKSISQIVPFHENTSSEVIDGAIGAGGEIFGIQKDCDLSFIQMQLVQIENQQSSLLDLFQKLIVSSQSSLNSLEMRVHSLEMALDEMSCGLSVSAGRLSNNDLATKTCCGFPGTEFLSSKLWRRTEGKYADIHDFGNRAGHGAFRSSLSFSTLWNKQKLQPCDGFENTIVELNSCSRASVQLTTTNMQESKTFDNGIKHLQDG